MFQFLVQGCRGHFSTSREFVPILMPMLINQKDPVATSHSDWDPGRNTQRRWVFLQCHQVEKRASRQINTEDILNKSCFSENICSPDRGGAGRGSLPCRGQATLSRSSLDRNGNPCVTFPFVARGEEALYKHCLYRGKQHQGAMTFILLPFLCCCLSWGGPRGSGSRAPSGLPGTRFGYHVCSEQDSSP